MSKHEATTLGERYAMGLRIWVQRVVWSVVLMSTSTVGFKISPAGAGVHAAGSPDTIFVARVGGAAPAEIGGTYRALVSSGLDNDGTVVFAADLDNASVPSALFAVRG